MTETAELVKSLAALLATAALILLAAAPAGAAERTTREIESAAKSARAVTAQMLTAPEAFSVKKKLPVRVSVRVPKGTTKLTVRVGNHDLSKRFRGGGKVRSASLDRGDGLRYGTNTVTVIAERGKSRRVIHSRTFYVVRPARGLVDLNLRTDDAVAAVTLKLRQPRVLTAAHLQKPGAVARQLEAMHRERKVRLWLNGRPVTRAIGNAQLTRWTAKLSATHGLRYGVNRLRAYVVEPETGRFQTLRRSFVVRRNQPLASAGWDDYSRVGSHVFLDGRRSRVAGDGQRALRWTIVSQPGGSKATLHGSSSTRPRLSPDRPGRYVVRLTVSERGKAGALNGTAACSDLAEITVAPRQLLLPFTGFVPAASGQPDGIKVAGTFYPKPSSGDFQWLTLNRSTLTPNGASANNWIANGTSGEHSFEGLYKALKGMGHDQLVVLTRPFNGNAAVNTDQVDEFNNVLNLLGAESMTTEQLTAGSQQLVVVGIPYSKPGSAWVSRIIGTPKTVFDGWLMPDAVSNSNGDLNFRFQPKRLAFDTEKSSTATTNTMSVNGQDIPASLPAGASGGFQIVAIDPDTFAPLDNRVYPTNSAGTSGGPLEGRREMAQYLRTIEPNRQLIAVQSIGSVANVSNAPEEQYVEDMKRAWQDLSRAIAPWGANPDTFGRANGSYAYLGGPRLTRAQAADSSSAVTIDPTTNPPQRESGTLQGRAAPTSKGVFAPVIASPVESPDLKLYDLVFRNPTPWPLTGEGEDAEDYQEALGYISRNLGAGPNIRATYWKNLEAVYSDDIAKLKAIPYPGNFRPCAGTKSLPAAELKGAAEPVRYTREEFCEMSRQLTEEFELLDKVKTMFDAYEAAFSRSGPVQQAELESMAKAIEDAIKPGNGGEIAWSVGGFIGNLISAGLVLDPEGAGVLAAWEALVTVYELTRELLGETGGVPVGEQVESKVGELGTDLAKKLEASSDGVERLRQVIVSDWGRLQAVGSVVGTPGWNVDVPTVKENLTNSAGAFFSSQLLPIPYGVHDLEATGFNPGPTAENCYTLSYGHTYRGAPETAKLEWMGEFDFQTIHGGFPSQFVLAVHSPSASSYSYPPAEVTDRIFRPQVQGGFGVQLPQYVWESYEDFADEGSPPGPSPPTYIAYCH